MFIGIEFCLAIYGGYRIIRRIIKGIIWLSRDISLGIKENRKPR